LATIAGRFLSVCTFHFKCFHLHTSVDHIANISRPTYYDVYNTRITAAVISSTCYICLVHRDARNGCSSSIIIIIYCLCFIDMTVSTPSCRPYNKLNPHTFRCHVDKNFTYSREVLLVLAATTYFTDNQIIMYGYWSMIYFCMLK